MPKFQPPVPRPHPAIYRLHRYPARRPSNLFAALIEHFTDPGDKILDPFCGGGVTVVEASRLGRSVIGVDLNPMATLITWAELVEVDLDLLEGRRQDHLSALSAQFADRYQTTCNICKEAARWLWLEWALGFTCSSCGELTEPRSARDRCNCGARVQTNRPAERWRPLRLLVACPHCGRHQQPASEAQSAQTTRAAADLKEMPEGWVPTTPLPRNNIEAENALHAKGITHWADLFFPRSALVLGGLRDRLACNTNEERLEWLVLSSALDYSTRCSRVVGGQGREITTKTLWTPLRPAENNVLFVLEKRWRALMAAKRSAHQVAIMRDPTPLRPGPAVLTTSSVDLPFANGSFDAVITDPPYGDHVQYTDISNLWAAWLGPVLNLPGLIPRTEEISMDRRRFPGAHDLEHYQRGLEGVFAETARVLRSGGRLVFTFQNRRPDVWTSMLDAASTAGFQLDPAGLTFAAPIAAYTTTLHQKRSGSLNGDFVLAFTKGAHGPTVSANPPLDHLLAILTETGPLEKTALYLCLVLATSGQMAGLTPETMEHLMAGDDRFNRRELGWSVAGDPPWPLDEEIASARDSRDPLTTVQENFRWTPAVTSEAVLRVLGE